MPCTVSAAVGTPVASSALLALPPSGVGVTSEILPLLLLVSPRFCLAMTSSDQSVDHPSTMFWIMLKITTFKTVDTDYRENVNDCNSATYLLHYLMQIYINSGFVFFVVK